MKCAEKHIMPLISSDGRQADMDLCCFCKKLKHLDHSGDCEHYAQDYIHNTCPGFVKVEDVTARVLEILDCRGKTTAD